MSVPRYSTIVKAGGIYDTRNYRYIIRADGCVYRVEIRYLDTTYMLRPDAWKKVNCK